MLDPTTTGLIVSAGTTWADNVVASTVLPGMVVVKVAWPPRAVTGMALPTPALVYGLGTASVDVFGFEGK